MCRPHKPEALTDIQRILLFEWHASHLQSWLEMNGPTNVTVKWPGGMDTQTFHNVTITFALLRKFYDKKDHVVLSKVIESILAELPAGQTPLKRRLKLEKECFRDYIRQTDSVNAPRGQMPEDVMYNVTYGLLIHADHHRMLTLTEADRGWTHAMTATNNGHKPVLELLATIQRAREDGTLALPGPHPAIWERSRPEPIPIDELNRRLGIKWTDDEGE